MRVLYLYDMTLPAAMAAPIQILHTARAAAAQGTDFIAAWADVPDPRAATAFYGVEPHPRLTVRPFFNFFTRRALRRSLAWLANDVDVIMSRGETGVRVFEALRGLSRRPRFVFEVHRHVSAAPGLLAGLTQGQATALEAAAVREADGLVCISEGVRQAMEEAYGPTAPALVLPSGTAPASVGPAADRDLDLIYAGKLERRKGIDLMLATMNHLPEMRLTLLGGNEAERSAAAAAAAALGVAGRVEFPGYVQPSAVRGWFCRARIGLCALPAGVSEVSDRFTSPMKILDMMACRTPIVATDLPSVREILTHDRNAVLVPPNDPAALAGAVRRLRADPELATALAARAAADVEAYTWPERARRLITFLEGLGSRSQAPKAATEAVTI